MTNASGGGGQDGSGQSNVRPVTPLAALIKDTMDRFYARTGVVLTQSDIARRGGLDKRQLSNYMHKRLSRPPSPTQLDALARGLGVPVEDVTVAALKSAGYKVPMDRWPTPNSDVG